MIDELSLIHSIAHRLDKFRPVNGNQSYRFRCNICGDSKKSLSKSRGFFIYSKQHQKYFFKCHNCGVSLSLETYAKEYFPEEFSAFKIKTFREKPEQISDKLKSQLDSIKHHLKNISKPEESELTEKYKHLFPVSVSQKTIDYIKSRKIPYSQWHRLYYTDNIGALIHEIDEHGKYEEHNLPEDERLVIIIFDESGNIKGAQGRSLPDNPTKLRYATYMFSDDHKIFGLEQIDWSKDVILTEGAIDSLFLENAIAMNGGSTTVIKSFTPEQKSKLIIALDNEPRHKDTVKRYEKEIENGYRLVDWSGLKTDKKDINDMVLSGIEKEKIQSYILSNNNSGAKAKLKFINWKQI